MARTIKTGLLRREFDLNRAALNEESRSIELSFSSEEPVERDFGFEVLDHRADSVDLSRLNNGGPLLMDHNTEDQIGVVELAKLEGKRGKATVRFSRSARAEEIFQDVKDGIRRLVSVGYRINKMVSEKAERGETFRAMSWTPMEISLVSVPADPTVGVGRSEQFEVEIQHMNTPETPVVIPPGNPEPEALMPGKVYEQQRDQGAMLERKRVQEISAICDNVRGKIPNVDELHGEAIRKGWSVEQTRAEIIVRLPMPAPISSSNRSGLDVAERDLRKYSLSRAITQMCNGRLSGIEAELSQEIAKRQGKSPDGFWVPCEVMTRNLIAGTNTLGGFVVETSNAGDQFIELLRNRSQVMRLGARTLMLDNPVTIPQQNAAGAVNWVGETVAATLGTGNFTQITLTPKGISAFQQYGKQLLATSNPSIDSIVRDDILASIATAIDLAALHGTGSSQPTGIANISGVGTVLLSANGLAINNATAYPALVSLESALGAANADQGSMAYLLRASIRGVLRTQTQFSSTDTPVYTSAPGNVDGVINGYRAAISNQVANNLTTGTATTITTPIFFGNWNELLIGNFNGGATDLVVDPYTLAANSVVRVIARQWVDINVRHPASFALLGGILGG
jgi:HK97 family phage major capsid protein